MNNNIANLKRCPVCRADRYDWVETSMGYQTLKFSCEAEFVIFKTDVTSVYTACPVPSYIAAQLLDSLLGKVITK